MLGVEGAAVVYVSDIRGILAMCGPRECGSGQVVAGCGQSELAVLHALGGHQTLRQVADASALAAQHQDLQAVVVVQVDVHGALDEVVGVVLV